MNASTDHLVQDVSSELQVLDLSVSVVQPEGPSAVSCDTNETIPDPTSEPIDPSTVVDPFQDPTNAVSQPIDLPDNSESVQVVDDTLVAQQLKFGPYSDRYLPHNHSYRLSRDGLREIAAATLDALDDGFYYPLAPKVVDLIGAEQTEAQIDGKETEADGMKEEKSNVEGKDEESEKEDRPSEAQDVADENAHSEVQDGMEVDIVDHRNAGREPYDLKTKIWNTNEHTLFIPPDDETMGLWYQAELPVLKVDEEKKKTRIIIAEYSTLVGSRRLQEITQDQPGSKGKIGVLNFASAKRAGGGFLNGSQAQEESLARSSTLYPSLLTPIAKQFYLLYAADPDNAFYTHSMVYSPSIILFRDDKGDWTAPIEVDILTSAAVNAGDVRKQVRWEEEMRALRERVRVAELARRRVLSLPTFIPTQVRIYESEPQKDDVPECAQPPLAHSEQPSASSVQVSPIIFASDPPSPPMEPISLPTSDLMSPILGVISTPRSHSPSSPYPQPSNVDPITHVENLIAAAMHERIARILYLFQLQGAKHLVLGSFGTGVFQNSVELIAGIFKDLLCDQENEDEGKGKENETQEEGGHGNEAGGVDEEGPPPIGGVSSGGKGKFKDVFETVMFAILGGSTVRTFKNVFEGVEGVDFDEEAEDSDVEGMRDVTGSHAQVRDTYEPPA